MTTRRRILKIRGIPVEIVRKNIKNLHLGVYPPHGRVRVAVPLRIKDDAIRLAVVVKFGWILRQQRAFAEQQRESKREMVSGESHLVGGRRYRLRVISHAGPAMVSLRGSVLEMHVRPGLTRASRDEVLQRWYRQRLRAQIPPLVAKWAPRVGATPADVRIRKMKTRWGSCNAQARRIWLNLELAKKPAACVEYIVVHELVHLIERRHNARFRELLSEVMPSWATRRDELNRAPLAHEEWRY